MPTHPSIHFHGKCGDVPTASYAIYCGTNPAMTRYSNEPETSPAWKDSPRIMHSQLTVGEDTLMASDFPPGTSGDPQKGLFGDSNSPRCDERPDVV